MKKIRQSSPFFLLFFVLVSLSRADEPPLIHAMPSGATLLISPSNNADYVSIQLFIDKRAFSHNSVQSSYVNAFLRNLESGLSNFKGIVQLFPFDFIPESPYNFQEQGYLIFKTSSIYFNQNLKSILEQFLGNIKPREFFLYNKNRIFERLISVSQSIPLDSVQNVNRWAKEKEFRKFINSVMFKKNMYLYISGNVNLFRVVSTALKIQNSIQKEKQHVSSKWGKNVENKYWSLVFRLFVIDRLKILLNGQANGKVMRVYMPVKNSAQKMALWVCRGHSDYALNSGILADITNQFSSYFSTWYKKHYVSFLSWVYDDDNQKGFYRLLSFMVTGNPDLPFKLKTVLDQKKLNLQFKEFIKRIQLGRPVAH